MKKEMFILGLIFLAETLFRLFPEYDPKNPPPTYDFFLFSSMKLSLEQYLYFMFEHVKVIGFVTILYVVNTRWKWLLYIYIGDLIVYLLNYSSTFMVLSGVAIGMDMIKLATFTIIILSYGREAYSDHVDNVTRNIMRYHSHWKETCYRLVWKKKASQE